MRFGVFDHLDRSDIPLRDFYNQRLRIAETYDQAGFYGYHMAEHHSTPLGMAPSPGIFLSALAQRTQRLRFGPMVYLLPLYHPLRLAEEIAMLDQLSDGRLEVGVGRGISPIETTFYGNDPAQSQAMFAEVLAVMRQAFSSDVVDFAGTYFRFQNVPVTVKPLQQPHPPLWYGISTPGGAARYVSNGFNGLSLARTEQAAINCTAFKAAAAEQGRTDLSFGIGRFIVVGETDAAAMAIARRAYHPWRKSFHYLYHSAGRSPVFGERPNEFDGIMELGEGVAGSVETVTAALQEQIRTTGADYLVGQFVFGDMSLDESLRSIERFSTRVMPALG
jgi:alkanesulfonate monooxygenase SsuD/methylene tetrahydromethanopterin reductase-like flavin-dependent oxidoreductase (luciferase family)